MEANDNPYAVQERLNKSVIDKAFDSARSILLGRRPDAEMVDEQTQAFEQKGSARICFHLARYFKAINQIE